MPDSIDLEFREALESHNRRLYISLARLGTGGSAETFLVLCTTGAYAGHVFAAKVFRRRSKPERRRSFLQEHAFLRDCTHPAIMRVFDDGFYADERPFFVAEYLPDTLSRQLRAPDVPLLTKLSYTLQLLSALKYLAAHDLVHRDIKPSNIFLKGGTCVLGDFGLMRPYDSPSTELDRVQLKESLGPGMPRSYRTPDLVGYLKGQGPPSPQSDVFQLGLVLAELFTGRNPQRPMSGNRFDSRIRMDPVTVVLGRFGAAIGAIISEMLQADPASRPSAADVFQNWMDLFVSAAQERHDLEGSVRLVT
jgi:serine/threonine protein kinase